MIQRKPNERQAAAENGVARTTESGERWLSGNASGKRRLWERLNPRHRKQLRLLARALVLRQAQARLPDSVRARLVAGLDELERLTARIEKLLVAVTSQTPPAS